MNRSAKTQMLLYRIALHTVAMELFRSLTFTASQHECHTSKTNQHQCFDS